MEKIIEFSGKIENEIQAKVTTKHGQFLGVLGLILAIVGLLISLIIWLIESSLDSESTQILIFSCALGLLSGIVSIPTSKNRLRFVWDYYIKFENESVTVVSNHQSGVTQSHNISKIKKVIDYGKYYYLFLYRIDPSKGIVCQKDLLIDGTIEEFEKLFEGKIKRKTIKKSVS